MMIDVAQSAIDTEQAEAGTASSEKSMVRIVRMAGTASMARIADTARIADMARTANMAGTAVMSVAMSIESAVGTGLVMMKERDTSSIHIILEA